MREPWDIHLARLARKREIKRIRDRCSEEQAHRCAYCGIRCTYGITLEHVIPKSKGGPTVYENCVMACERCNLKRKTTDAFKYFAALQASGGRKRAA